MVNAAIGTIKCDNEDPGGLEGKDQIDLKISTSQTGLTVNENSGNQSHDGSFVIPWRSKLLKFGSLASPSLNFQRLAEERDEISRQVQSSSSLHLREHFNRIFSQKIDWTSLSTMCKEWIRNPMNMALFVWIICVAVSGAILFLVMTGMLNRALPKKSQRDAWFEVNNQILNALFTLMCLYQHPKRCYHLVLLLRWEREDIAKLRKIYCKNGTYKPHEWMHMLVVVSLLHINCVAQYALCGLNLGYRRSNRPAIGVGICISVAIASPAIAGIYSILSPLGKEYNVEVDLEAQSVDSTSELKRKSFEKRFSFVSRDERRIVESRPQWSGGVLGFWDDISLAYSSLFCGFCVFGWNMERLGFGNMYVHIATFILFCTAPFWIFNLAAVNIDNNAARVAMGITGIFLCLFGLLYGGYWRIRFRKRFNLPPYTFCCRKPAVTDFVLWLFCCWCSLAQEVRTANSYDIVEDKFYRKTAGEGDSLQLPPLPREDREYQNRSGPSSPLTESFSLSQTAEGISLSPSRFSNGPHCLCSEISLLKEEFSGRGNDEIMVAPAPPFIHKETH